MALKGAHASEEPCSLTFNSFMLNPPLKELLHHQHNFSTAPATITVRAEMYHQNMALEIKLCDSSV